MIQETRIQGTPSSHGPILQLLYHQLTLQRGDYKYALCAEEFEAHLQLFKRLRSSGTAAIRPEITFDDGHLSDIELALPLLCRYGFTARFFITAGWTSERAAYMNWNHLRTLLQAGQKVGAHGWSHTLLTHCSAAQLDYELKGARQVLEDKLGIPITTLSLPGGRFNQRVLEACRRAGYTQVFSSVPRAETSSTAMLVGRVNLRSDANTRWLEGLLTAGSKQLRRLQRDYYLKHAAQRVLGDALYGKLWGVLNKAQPEAQVRAA